jgi:hypothetical protein
LSGDRVEYDATHVHLAMIEANMAAAGNQVA